MNAAPDLEAQEFLKELAPGERDAVKSALKGRTDAAIQTVIHEASLASAHNVLEDVLQKLLELSAEVKEELRTLLASNRKPIPAIA